MTAKVLPFTGITCLDLDADQVLEAAKGQLEGVLVVGFDKEGELYAAGSYADGATVLWLMEGVKRKLFGDPA